MARGVYAEINLHITWHTKGNATVLTDTVESQLHRYLEHRALKTPGVVVHAVGGTADHVHMVLSVPPTLCVSDWIGELKGASAYYTNHKICNRKVVTWQNGYGVVSFGTKDLPWVVDYVRNQMMYHGAGTAHERLERVIVSDADEQQPQGKPVETG